MSFSKWERISGYVLFTRLCGDDHIKGEFFNHPHDITDKDHSLKVIDSLSEEDINSSYALMLLAKQAMNDYNRTAPLYKQCLVHWLPKAKPEVVNKAFEEWSSSLTWESALQSKDIYKIFLREGQIDNPWTQENCNKPGYAVLPFFSLIDSTFPETMPARALDQKAFIHSIEDLKSLNETDDQELYPSRYHKIVSQLKKQWYDFHPKYQQLRTKNTPTL